MALVGSRNQRVQMILPAGQRMVNACASTDGSMQGTVDALPAPSPLRSGRLSRMPEVTRAPSSANLGSSLEGGKRKSPSVVRGTTRASPLMERKRLSLRCSYPANGWNSDNGRATVNCKLEGANKGRVLGSLHAIRILRFLKKSVDTL